MGTLAALLVATPIFGLSLDIDPSLDPAVMASPVAVAVASVDDGGAAASPEEEARPNVGELMRQRQKIAPIHKWLGIATWVSMTATVFLGYIQWYNLYGFFAGRDDNPCVEGNAVFGQGQCTGTPVPHLASAITTAALYSITFGLSYRMPDPINLDEGDSEYARNLRTHKVLRWIHLAGMVAQMGLGLIVANSDRLGLDRANDYGTLQALSTVHLGVGLITFAALTWAGAIMLF